MNRLIVGGVVACAFSAAAVAQQVGIRTVYVSIVDKKGTPVTGITTSDVVVTEDGRARQVLSVSQSNEPMTVALVVDGYLMRLSPALQESVTAFVAAMPPDATLGIFAAGPGGGTIVDFTRNRTAVVGSVPFPVAGGGGTPVETIAHSLARRFRQAQTRRSAIVILTIASDCRAIFRLPGDCQGLKVYESSNWDLVVEDLQRSETAVYAAVARGQGDAFLGAAAAATGGRVLQVLGESALPSSLSRIAAELLARRAITYAASAAASEKGGKLDVKVAGAAARAAKRVY